MARITGLEKSQAPWHLRWYYTMMRRMFSKGSVAMEGGLAKKRSVSLRYIQLGKVRAASRIGCPF
jgi:hypothetical protein